MDLSIIFEDKSLMVIDKPPNLVVDLSLTHRGEALAQILQKQYGILLNRGGIVHRLDKDTSGLMLVAKTLSALDDLQRQFRERIVKKKYIGLIHGLMEQEVDVEKAVGRNPKRQENFIVLDEGRPAQTKFIPIKTIDLIPEKLGILLQEKINKNQLNKLKQNGYGKFSLIAVQPLTGRTHQIRVHLKYINFPLVGDDKYAGRKTARLDHKWCPRQFLHASKLSFYHPESKKLMEFESNLPSDLDQVLNLLQTLSK